MLPELLLLLAGCTESTDREAEHEQAHQQAGWCTWEGSVPPTHFPEANTALPVGLGFQPMLTEQPCLSSSSWLSCVSNAACTALFCFEWLNKSSILFKIKSKFKFWLKYCSLLMLLAPTARANECPRPCEHLLAGDFALSPCPSSFPLGWGPAGMHSSPSGRCLCGSCKQSQNARGGFGTDPYKCNCSSEVYLYLICAVYPYVQ